MKKLLTGILLSIFSLQAFAKHHEHQKAAKGNAPHQHKSHKKHRRQHKAHEHGIATLDMTFDESRSIIDLLLTVPMDDLVGFEHKARTDEERKKVNLKKEELSRSPLARFSPEAKCQQKSFEIIFPEITHKKHEHKKHEHKKHEHKKHEHKKHEHKKHEHKKHEHKKHEHKKHEHKKHEHKKHEHKKHEHKKHEHGDHEHSDVQVVSSFFCKTPKAISSMSFDIFAKMPKTKKIKFRYTGFHDSTKKTGEGVGYLTPKSPKITL